MAYRFNDTEIAKIKDARDRCPRGEREDVPTPDGDWKPFYTTLSEIIGERINDGSVSGADLQDLKNAKLWLDVAIGANSGDGVHSVFIREFTNRQGVLRRDSEFSVEEMQFASNGVALNLWNDLSDVNSQTAWTVPKIDEIARADASSIGINLFGDRAIGQQLPDPDDSAIKANAGWSGTLGFNLLGGSAPYESWRLLTGGDGGETTGATLNTLDDFKNVLFAVDSYHHAMQVSPESILSVANAAIDFLALGGGYTGDTPYLNALVAQWNISSSSGVWNPLIKTVAERSPEISPLVNFIVDRGASIFLDMLRGSIAGTVKIGETSAENFAQNAYEFFAEFSALQLQSIEATLPASPDFS